MNFLLSKQHTCHRYTKSIRRCLVTIRSWHREHASIPNVKILDTLNSAQCIKDNTHHTHASILEKATPSKLSHPAQVLSPASAGEQFATRWRSLALDDLMRNIISHYRIPAHIVARSVPLLGQSELSTKPWA